MFGVYPAWISYAAVSAALIASHLGAYSHGHHVAGVACSLQAKEIEATSASALYDQAVAYAASIVEQQGKVDTLAQELETARAAQAPKTRIITREVIKYANLPADRRCTLDSRWRLLHDAAATGIPAPADGSATSLAPGAGDPVTDAAALETVTSNYAQCRSLAAQLAGWQRWWVAVNPRHADAR